jgi:hypothetical protein
VWWHVPAISALRRLRQKDCELEARLDCMVRPGPLLRKREKESESSDRERKKSRGKRMNFGIEFKLFSVSDFIILL